MMYRACIGQILADDSWPRTSCPNPEGQLPPQRGCRAGDPGLARSHEPSALASSVMNLGPGDVWSHGDRGLLFILLKGFENQLAHLVLSGHVHDRSKEGEAAAL